MKKIIFIIAIILFAFTLQSNAKPSFGGGISFGIFYSSLNPYGEWIQIDADLYGWRPRGVHRNWRPYSIGRWDWTRDGWYWDSYEPFGWATYHYGRWYYDDYYGWIWLPDYEWGPSWVEWRYDDNYIGWAPLPPYASFRINFGIHFSISWHSGYHHWNFVPYNRFCGYRVDHYLLDSRRSRRIFDNTRYRTNYYSDGGRIINGGMEREQIERRSGYRIAERDLKTIDNYKDFERVRSSGSKDLYSYRPSEREVEKYRDNQKYEMKKSEREIGLVRDKVMTSRNKENVRIQSAEQNRDVQSRRARNDDYKSIDRERKPELSNPENNKRVPDRKIERNSAPERSNSEIRRESRSSRQVQPERNSAPKPERKIESNQNRSSSQGKVRESPSNSRPKRETESKSSRSAERKRG